jgi:predicted transcriptional regulator
MEIAHMGSAFQFAPVSYNILNSYTEATGMNFNIYLDDETGQQLNQVAKQTGESRNALVRQAVSDWLNRHGKPQWPDEVLAFKGMANLPLFEASRDALKPPVADPLA